MELRLGMANHKRASPHPDGPPKWLESNGKQVYNVASTSPESAPGFFVPYLLPEPHLKANHLPMPTRTVSWTRERIDTLVTADIRQLRVNAERLNDPDIMKLCDSILSQRRKRGPAAAKTGAAAAKAGTSQGGAA
jgi:hypothetical protein